MCVRSIAIVLSFLLLAGCKTITEGVEVESSPGVIHGVVLEAPSALGNIGVSAGAMVQSNLSSRTAITDSNGHYELELPTGTHTLTVSKAGYGEVKIFSVVIAGAGRVSVPWPELVQKPQDSFVVDSSAIAPPDTYHLFPEVTLIGHSSIPDSISRGIAFIVSLYHSIEDATQDNNPYDVMVEEYRSSAVSAEFPITPDIYNAGFTSNEMVYLRVRRLNYYNNIGAYDDPVLGKKIYSAVGPAGPVSHLLLP